LQIAKCKLMRDCQSEPLAADSTAHHRRQPPSKAVPVETVVELGLLCWGEFDILNMTLTPVEVALSPGATQIAAGDFFCDVGEGEH
jgi:hypothetical protein